MQPISLKPQWEEGAITLGSTGLLKAQCPGMVYALAVAVPNAWVLQWALVLRSSDICWPVVLRPVPRHPCLPQHRQAGGLLSVFSSQLTWAWTLEERVGQSVPPRVSGLPGPNHSGVQVGRLAAPASPPAQAKL